MQARFDHPIPSVWAYCGALRVDADGRLHRAVLDADGDYLRTDRLGTIDGGDLVPDELAEDLAALREAWADSETISSLHAQWAADHRAAAAGRHV